MTATPIHTFQFPKDPGETLKYTWDFTNLLAAGESITTINTTVVTPTTVPALTVPLTEIVSGAKKVNIYLAGGEACKTYTITVNVTTDSAAPANIFERSCRLVVESR